ncbi:MAG: InlB B-repeat-containing protein [Solobacterium sp.]|nr:InlB B-repeat-containing protein [Solobacterium sp.]
MKRKLMRIFLSLILMSGMFCFSGRSVSADVPQQPGGLEWIGTTAIWNYIPGAESYDAALWNTEKQLTSVTVSKTSYDFKNEMEKYGTGYYRFVVQAVNQDGKSLYSQYSGEYFYHPEEIKVSKNAGACLVPPIEGNLPDLSPVSVSPYVYDVSISLFNNSVPCWFSEGTIANPDRRMSKDETFDLFGQYFVDIVFTPKEGFALDLKNGHAFANDTEGFLTFYDAKTNSFTYRFDFVAQEKGSIHKVKFMLTDGTVIRETYVKDGETVTKPDPVEMDNMYFDGWFTTVTGGSPYQFDEPLSSDLNLYARLIPIMTGITLKSSGNEKNKDGYWQVKPDVLDYFLKAGKADINMRVGPFEEEMYSHQYIKTEPEIGKKYYFSVVIKAGKEAAPTAYFSDEMKTGNTVSVANADVSLVNISHSVGASEAVMVFTYVRTEKKYAVNSAPAKYGTFSVSQHTAVEGTEITVKAKPEKGYIVKKASYRTPDEKETDITKTLKFKMPASDVIVAVTFAKEIKTIEMHRLYNPNSWEHFYTGNTAEKDALVKLGWKYEGVGWKAPETSSTPVYRLYNPNNGGDHHYTKNKKEYDALIKAGWTGEDIRWYSDDEEAVPVYREYNPGAAIRNHNYTANKKEHDALVGWGWKDEGIGWYGVK